MAENGLEIEISASRYASGMRTAHEIPREPEPFVLTQRELWICQREPHNSQVGDNNTSDVSGISLGVLHRVDDFQNLFAAPKLLVAVGEEAHDKSHKFIYAFNYLHAGNIKLDFSILPYLACHG
jgi:hypothetical protein